MSSTKTKPKTKPAEKTEKAVVAVPAVLEPVESVEPEAEKPLTTVEQLARVEDLLAEANRALDGLREERHQVAEERRDLTISVLPSRERAVSDTADKLNELKREMEQQELRASIFRHAGSIAVAERIEVRLASLREEQAELLQKLASAEEALAREQQFVAREGERIDAVLAEKQVALDAADATVSALAQEKQQLMALRHEEVQHEARAAVTAAAGKVVEAEQALKAARFQQEATVDTTRRTLKSFGLYELADEIAPRPPTAAETMYAAYAAWLESLAPVAGHLDAQAIDEFIKVCFFGQRELAEILRGLPEDRQNAGSIINQPAGYAVGHSIRSNTATARALYAKWQAAMARSRVE